MIKKLRELVFQLENVARVKQMGENYSVRDEHIKILVNQTKKQIEKIQVELNKKVTV